MMCWGQQSEHVQSDCRHHIGCVVEVTLISDAIDS